MATKTTIANETELPVYQRFAILPSTYRNLKALAALEGKTPGELADEILRSNMPQVTAK